MAGVSVPYTDAKLAGHALVTYKVGTERRWRYWNTDIVTLTEKGVITLNSGGWHTMSTKAKINAILSDLAKTDGSTMRVHLWADKGVWTLNGSTFFDGIQLLLSTGEITNLTLAAKQQERTKLVISRVKVYCDALRKHLEAVGPVVPTNDDCDACCEDSDPVPAPGEHNDHLWSHIVGAPSLNGTLVLNALEWAGWSESMTYYHYLYKCPRPTQESQPLRRDIARMITGCVRRYLKNRLGV